MQHLETLGYAVIPLPEDIKYSFDIHSYLSQQVEFNHSDVYQQFVLGAFGALGNPSSFHHPAIRKLRVDIFNHMAPIFGKLYSYHYLSMLPDRFCIRRNGCTLSSESWHRDKSYDVTPHERIYGGWMNLDCVDQYFSCIPQSHNDAMSDIPNGFDKFDKEHQKQFKALSQLITIPPDHILIFNERLIHEVRNHKYKEDSYRLFTKWFISPVPRQLIPNIQDICKAQAVPPLSMAQYPPMFSKLHQVNWRPQLQEFSRSLKPEFLDEYHTVLRFLPSLESVGMLFPEYSPTELAVFLQHFLIF